MGLVALRDFVGNDGRQYKAGDSCDEALEWRYPALRGALNMGVIGDTDGTVDNHLGRLSDRQLNVLRAERRAERRAEARAAAGIVKGALVPPSAAPVPPTTADELVAAAAASGVPMHDIKLSSPVAAGDAPSVPDPTSPAAGEPAADNSAPKVLCTACDKTFASEHAMRIHHGKAHRE